MNKLPARDSPSNTSHKDNGETIVASEKSFRSVKVKLKKEVCNWDKTPLSVKFADPCNLDVLFSLCHIADIHEDPISL